MGCLSIPRCLGSSLTQQLYYEITIFCREGSSFPTKLNLADCLNEQAALSSSLKELSKETFKNKLQTIGK